MPDSNVRWLEIPARTTPRNLVLSLAASLSKHCAEAEERPSLPPVPPVDSLQRPHGPPFIILSMVRPQCLFCVIRKNGDRHHRLCKGLHSSDFHITRPFCTEKGGDFLPRPEICFENRWESTDPSRFLILEFFDVLLGSDSCCRTIANSIGNLPHELSPDVTTGENARY